MASTFTTTRFDYWNILIGQGQYYKLIMIENGDTSELDGYVTDVVTDISLKELKNVIKTFLFDVSSKSTTQKLDA